MSNQGWLPDPTGRYEHRYYDGTKWTDQVASQGRQTVDALDQLPNSRPAGATQVLVQVGDIACTQTEVITPAGTFPLAGTVWIVSNNTQVSESIPAWAIVLAIVFFLFCLLGLLFLLVKQRSVRGYVQVSVQGPNLYYATQIPVSDTPQIGDVEQRVNYIRSLVVAAAR